VRRERASFRVLVVDLDAHQGNGVASIFAEDEDVAVFDVYNGEIWPGDEEARRAIRWEHPLPSGTSGAAYLELLRRELPRALDEFEPQLLLYNAGTDIVAGDPLGLLEVAHADVSRRDFLVLEEAARRALPTVVVPSGGYTDASHRLLAELLVGVAERWL
jgi:histone deacetylase 11